MKNKILIFLICGLLVSSSIILVSGDKRSNEKKLINSLSFPSDFELDVFSGGSAPWTKLFRLQIDSGGQVVYSIMYPKDRGSGVWTTISNFVFSSDELSVIWNAIVKNDFFGLNDSYNGSEVDGTFANMAIIANNQNNIVNTENIGVRKFDDIVRTINSLTPGSYDLFYNALFNRAPEKPNTPSGLSSGKTGKEYTYTTFTNDYNIDHIYYLFNWSDGTDSGWVGPFNSSEIGFAKHKWQNQGSYNISVIAKDDPNSDGDLSDGLESRWSDPLPISMPKTKKPGFVSMFLFERIKNTFQFLKKLLNNDEFDHIPLFAYFDNSGTQVTIKDCTITVTIRIQIHGPGANVTLAQQMESEIESVWSTDSAGNSWKIQCAFYCERQQPGCSVKFDAIVVRMPAGEVLPGFHDIEVGKDESADGNGHISSVDKPLPQPNSGSAGSGNWDNNEPAGTWAHEAGHLMGSNDEYTVTSEDPYRTQPNPGHDNDIMADLNGKPTQDAIEDIVANGGVECPCECCPEENDTEEPEVDIDTPHDGSSTTGPVIVGGTATDIGGSGVAELDYRLEWNDGSYNGNSQFIDPPKEEIGFSLGPIPLDQFIEVGDWIKIIIYAIDDAGNIGSDYVTVTLIEEDDTTPPVTIKTIGQPQAEDGYIIWPQTPITFTATDDMSGVNHIHYDIWWDSNGDHIIDTQVASQDIYSSSTTFTVGSYGVLFGLIQLKWYAVDNAQNQEETHIQNHMVMGG